MAAALGGPVVRCVDAGSCDGRETGTAAAFGPVHDAERYGARLVASSRHADVALVTGPVTRNTSGLPRCTVAAAMPTSPRHADVAPVTGPVTRNTSEPQRRTVATMPHPRPVPAAGALAVGLLAALALVRVAARRGRKLWDRGGGAPRPGRRTPRPPSPSPSSASSATSSHPGKAATSRPSTRLVERVRFRRRVPDRIEHRLNRPLIAALDRLGGAVRGPAPVRAHRYLGYGFCGLVALLLTLAVGW
ncbi:hypothetical protein [Streptomyces sp. HU2014]|uniref:hypothetical protein n=1 Tax=Streptomyces sp. HU2014 TaxID=2939414 RepID=UPI0024B394BC|nr:hypothetical protein [Streptomyces sp. HU2014]